ncbi:uncharacterized protein LOC123525952 [Mercenaria mercenaria]|uniref:uncharacterized protein LOC123525952 n=1 Tax=Mercenaria mercenaria TaxID=6596 RepID=UPI00234EE600|nr:uncharacterized protein LOC123525952 [Mercenaria mercenaria]
MATGWNNSSTSTHDYYDALEQLGYTKTMSEKRVKIYNAIAENSTLFCRRSKRKNIDVLILGSRGEGIGIWGNSDVDMLYVQRCVKCADSYTRSNTMANAPVLFQLEFENVESGYTMLRLMSIEYSRNDKQFIRNIQNALVQKNGYHYLRNDQVFTAAVDHHREGIARQQFVFDDTTGPARKIICELPFLDNLSVDRVLALPCSSPSIINDWCNRKRMCGWPSKDLLDKVKDLDVFVVPVGVRESVDEVLQWRISVTLAEQTLVHSFSDTQIKLYAALKMLTKHELHPVCENVSSYVVKNIIFWMIEETPAEKFTREKFGDCLFHLLKRFKKCVTWRYLPNYMLPSNNMLKNRIYEKERVELIYRLDLMIEEGSSVLLRCPLVREMTGVPKEIFQQRIIFLELAEQAALSLFCIPPSQFKILTQRKIIHKSLFYLTVGEIMKIVLKHVFPLIRRYNPFEYFRHVISMEDDEILRRLFEGVFLYLQKDE